MQESAAVKELIDEAENRHRAKIIRAYVSAVRAQARRDHSIADHAEWIGWARDQADRLDPLCQSPPSVLDTPISKYRKLGQFEILSEDGAIEVI